MDQKDEAESEVYKGGVCHQKWRGPSAAVEHVIREVYIEGLGKGARFKRTLMSIFSDMTLNTRILNDTRPPLTLSSNSSLILFMNCFFVRADSIIFTTYTATDVLLLLPLYIFILYHGFQQWKQKRSSSSLTTISHSDCFTYNTAIMELMGVIGCILNCCAIYKVDFNVLLMSFFLNFNWFGQLLFHILTCVERYLAVVHPITYLSLRNEKGIRIRNISIGCVWLLCFVGMGLSLIGENYVIVNLCFLIFTISIISFCSISVLCVLIGSGPGEQVGGKERTGQSKHKAFHTIVAILGALVLRFSFSLVRNVLYVSYGYCHFLLAICQLWLNIPSSLVLPFLLLQRAGKLEFLKRSRTSG